MTGWPTKKLGEICREGGGFIRTGPFGSQLHQSDYTEDPAGIPVVMPKDMAEGQIELSSVARIDSSTAERLWQHLLAAGDVVLSRRGDVGRSAWISSTDLPAFCGTGSMRVHPGQPTSVRPEFLRFFFRSRFAAEYFEAHAVGATMPNLNAKIVENLPVPVLPHSVQNLAVSLLTALEDLIDNNRRRAGVLKEIVRTIYREWFTRFQFPGGDSTLFIDTPDGPAPEGWTWSTCGDELDFIGGGTPSKKEPAYWEDGTVAWYTPTDLTKNRWRYAAEPALCITETGVSNSSARRFPAGSVMMTSRATLGVLAIATNEATTNQGFIVVLPDDRWSPGFIREWLDVHSSELAAIATGATFKEITKGAFKRIPFLLPPKKILDAYAATTEPIETNILNLERQVRSLSTLRDLVLPRLVTGQIDVAGLDVDALVAGAVA